MLHHLPKRRALLPIPALALLLAGLLLGCFGLLRRSRRVGQARAQEASGASVHAAADSSPSFFYFAYGSDLSVERLRQGGGPSARKHCVAKLAGRDFAYTSFSNVWKGGVADVVPAAEDRVAFGVVYELQAQDRAALDKQKGAGRPDAMYRSEQVVATCVKDGAQVRALTYSIADSRRASQNLAPSAQYKQCIVKGARSSGLPPAYVKQLEDIPDNGSTYRRKGVSAC